VKTRTRYCRGQTRYQRRVIILFRGSGKELSQLQSVDGTAACEMISENLDLSLSYERAGAELIKAKVADLVLQTVLLKSLRNQPELIIT
jgi:hypothetical protein